MLRVLANHRSGLLEATGKDSLRSLLKAESKDRAGMLREASDNLVEVSVSLGGSQGCSQALRSKTR